MRQKLVIANWKMNGGKAHLSGLLDKFAAGILKPASVVVCPPSIYIPLVEEQLLDSAVLLGAQDVSPYAGGAHTGELAISMLQEFGCTYVIVGHSERRNYQAETDQLVADKFAAVIAGGLTPVLCVGETLDEHERGKTKAVVLRQLDAVIKKTGIEVFNQAVVAYEPVWAIGTGKTATPDQAQQVHALIRGRIAELSGTVSEQLKILYGGSVKAANAQALFTMPDIDGGLVGGASLDAEEFTTICNAAG